jgi:hypothetical protein
MAQNEARETISEGIHLMSTWPAWRYRVAEGRIIGAVFASEAEVPAGEGWGDVPNRDAPLEVSAVPEVAARIMPPADEPSPDAAPGDDLTAMAGEPIDFAGLSIDDLRDIAAKAGVKIDGRWKRARVEQALTDAGQNGGNPTS